ncbi:MAG: CHASE2 domain-containing protein [Thiomargarita sp.]|nr:CHASE2 domain-containing protein [Thiomargarita sp.]
MSKLLNLFNNHALRLLFSVSILLFFVLHVVKVVEWDFINALEYEIYDTRLESSIPQTLDNRIVILDIDEKSLNEIGRWPWNRAVIAGLIDQLFDTYHIDVLGMDVVFAESDESSGLKKLQLLSQDALKDAPKFLEILKSLENTLNYDQQFSESLRHRRIILGYTFSKNDTQIGQLPTPIITKTPQNLIFEAATAQGFVANLSLFQNNAKSAGHFDVFPDSDGIVRRIPMLYRYQGHFYESLSLAVTRMALGNPKITLDVVQSLGILQVGDKQIPVDQHIQTLIPYRGKSQKFFTYVSASDVLYGRVQENLKDKIVLFGTSAAGLRDSRATPVEKDYPSVELHANLISGILNENLKANSDYIPNLELFLVIFIAIVMIIVLPLLSPWLATFGTLTILGFIFLLNLIIWHHMHIVLPFATTFLLILVLFIFNMSYGYIVESRHKRQLTDLFGQYIPPELVKEMSHNPGCRFTMEGESRYMTVLFSDIRDFTSISENFDPKELSQLMNEYLTPMTHVIHQERGTIDKYMGDAIMAFWGAPLPDSQHAFHALEAAMGMLKRLKKMQSEFKEKGWPELRIGIGLNTGIMNIGNMGSQFRIAYTVLGDAVNLGSRLEGVTKQYGTPIIVSETTKNAVPEYIYRELDCVKVKGKEKPVSIFEPIGRVEEVGKSMKRELEDYAQALIQYRQQSWEMAKAQFTTLQTQYPKCMLYRMYIKRLTYFMTHSPGEHWNGVYIFKNK